MRMSRYVRVCVVRVTNTSTFFVQIIQVRNLFPMQPKVGDKRKSIAFSEKRDSIVTAAWGNKRRKLTRLLEVSGDDYVNVSRTEMLDQASNSVTQAMIQKVQRFNEELQLKLHHHCQFNTQSKTNIDALHLKSKAIEKKLLELSQNVLQLQVCVSLN